MGQVRDFDFDAVVGVGGDGQKAKDSGVAGLVNWLGVGPMKRQQKCRWGYTTTIVRFEKFRHLVQEKVGFRRAARNWAKRIYDGKIRILIVDERYPRELREANRLLGLVDLSEVRGVKAKSNRKRACSPSIRSCR